MPSGTTCEGMLRARARARATARGINIINSMDLNLVQYSHLACMCTTHAWYPGIYYRVS